MTVDYEQMMTVLKDMVPFNTHLGIEIVEMGRGVGVTRLPEAPHLLNHERTQHAGALFSAGEAASGAAAVGAFGAALMTNVALVRSAHIIYRARAKGEITATARTDKPPDYLLAALESDGRVQFQVNVDLTDAQDRRVAEMTVEWDIRERD
jgi:acyl-coenzyme A thioesterase PaaI-like protein